MRKNNKILICLFLIISVLSGLFVSCKSDDNKNNGDILADIVEKYKTDGLVSWWQVAAIYNLGENPADYKGFDELCQSFENLEKPDNIKMASYVIIANAAILSDNNLDSSKFKKYEEYKSVLKDFLEEASGGVTVNYYMFAYYALKSSGIVFDEIPVANYIINAQKSDGGFALSGDFGDADMTSFAIVALELMSYNPDINISESLDKAVKFLEENIGEDGTYSSYDNSNANSTACALSALISVKYDGEIKTKAINGLELFKIIKTKQDNQSGYSFLKTSGVDPLATAQSLIALGDLKNDSSVWIKLYLDSQTKFNLK